MVIRQILAVNLLHPVRGPKHVGPSQAPVPATVRRRCRLRSAPTRSSRGRCQTITHDYQRRGTTTRFAGLTDLDETMIGRCMQRHRHREFIRFLNAVEREVAAGKVIHTVLDN